MMKRMTAVFLFAFFCLFPRVLPAGDFFTDTFYSYSQTGFTAEDIRRFRAKHPDFLTPELSFAFGIQTAKLRMNPDEVRNALPEDLHESFNKGYALEKTGVSQGF